ncbi:MAG: hypothetical protein J6J36_05105 [Clostridia bacterium]|nr:hypothetical protein [Clostridia bacterium]MBP3707968.1 hypothetical protein [Clostridia bacterium]
MIEILYKFANLSASFINKIFEFEIEFSNGQFVQIGKVVCPFVVFVVCLYLTLDALGILDKEE